MFLEPESDDELDVNKTDLLAQHFPGFVQASLTHFKLNWLFYVNINRLQSRQAHLRFLCLYIDMLQMS